MKFLLTRHELPKEAEQWNVVVDSEQQEMDERIKEWTERVLRQKKGRER